MISKPHVSIIVPCYNVEKYVEQCVNSIISQDYRNWECILINDGSSDSTLDLIKYLETKDDRIRVFTQKNLGLSATRNKGIDNSNGEFLFFLDSDDILSNDAISTLVSSFQNNDIITSVIITSTFSNDNIINKISQLLHPKEGTITFENSHFEVLVRTMETGLTPVAQNRLYRKDFIDKNKIRFKSGILHEDELWFFETMLLARNVKFINSETYFYRIDNQDSITKNVGDRNLESYIQVMEEIFKKYSQHKHFNIIANWYVVYIKKIFLDFAIRERSKISDHIILRLESALKNCYSSLEKESVLSKNNDIYYKTINKLSLHDFSTIEKYFFRNPINSLRKIMNVIKITYFLKTKW
ncbi:glycosyltransferase involved in cell wall biosynthesis [Chryseobacterium rhizosphaerae]|uniref:glycosyltransferase family 2 protein n=1 Tax=Chryseobacterium rhizosphaerae TaxID=395937 RepID=UPI00285F51C3|nr:glycosyltransferase [Chryseobacterium rhizosphaerae]MDR6546844.1 glycosyltransferase involved in cell wall biosynthesis [Chryseobacterium rhizosphaerae]